MTTIPSFETFTATLLENGIALLKFNRPSRGNALNVSSMREYLEAMRWADSSREVKVIVQTGEGASYSTGMELGEAPVEDPSVSSTTTLQELTDFLITCKKVLIAAVNGLAAGYGMTSLAHYDLVYSVPDAYFFTPFMKWGASAEGSSSVTFIKVLGYQRAAALLLAGERLSAAELQTAGMITRIIPQENFIEEVLAVAGRIATYPAGAVELTKGLMKRNIMAELMDANKRECIALVERLGSKESIDARANFVKDQKKKERSML